MRPILAVVALIVAASFACAGTEAPAPDAGPADPQPPAQGGVDAQRCALPEVTFKTKEGSFKGLRETIAALDTMSKGQEAKYQVNKGTKIPCEVDLSGISSYGDVIDTVILTNDGRGLLLSSGTSSIRSIQILDLETNALWSGGAVEAPKSEGDSILVRNLGGALPEANWPKDCDASLKGQMTCQSWEEIRWKAGVASPTGAKGGTITE